MQEHGAVADSKKSDLSFLLRKGGLAFMLRGMTMAGQYLLVFTLARLYGPAVMGNFTIALTILQLFAILTQLGLDNRLVRVVAAANNAQDIDRIRTSYLQSLRLTLVSSVLGSAFIFFFSGWIASAWFHKPQLEESLRYIGIALTPFVLMGLNGAGFRGLKNMTGFLLFRGLIPFLAVIPLFFSTSLSPAFAYTFATFILCAGSFITWYQYASLEKGVIATKESATQILTEAFPMMLTGSIFFLLNWTDNLMLGILRTETEVGLYDTGFKIASASGIVLMAFNSIQAPQISANFTAGKINLLNRQVQQATKLIFYITVPFTLVLFIFPEWILNIFGPEFIAAKNTMLILAFGNFINCISGSVGILLQMTGNQQVYNKIVVIAAVGSIVLNFYLIPAYGIAGAAISSCLAKIFHNIASVIYAYRKMGVLTFYFPGINSLLPVNKSTAS